MAEQNLYQPLKDRLSELLATKGRQFYLEVTATKGLSEKTTEALHRRREGRHLEAPFVGTGAGFEAL